jgi:hypothetical protein
MSKKSRRKFPVVVVVIGFMIIGALWGAYRFSPHQSASLPGIFVITPLEYGNTTLIGVLQKDTSVGKAGKYLLTVNDRIILLDTSGVDSLVGTSVKVAGYLTPPIDSTSLPTMSVTSMESQ